MLVLTPRPHPTECISGYLHRLSAANGYTKPSWIIEPYRNGYHADDYRRVTPAVIQEIAGLTRPEAERVCVRPDREGDRTTIRLVGTELHVSHVDMRVVRICPSCVAEKGQHEAFWHLRTVQWCPLHRAPLLEKCRQCGVALRWNRPGIGQCNCGADLTKQTAKERCSTALAELLLMMRHALYRDPAAAEPPSSLRHLHHLDLYRLMRLVETLESVVNSHLDQKASAIVVGSEALTEVARILGNWPRNFQRFLQTRYRDDLDLDSSRKSFKRTFPWAFWTLGRNLKEQAHQLDFLRDEVMRFGAYHWTREQLGRASTHATIARLHCEWGSIPDAASLIGIDQRTLLQRVRDGLVPAQKAESVLRNRNYKINLDWARQQNFDHEELTIAKAAVMLGLPLSLFNELVVAGVYKSETITRRRDRLSEQDVMNFKRKLDVVAKEHFPGMSILGIFIGGRRLNGTERVETRASFIRHLSSCE